jgi:glutamate dehydrogenase
VPVELATRVLSFDTLYAALDIIEVAGSAKRTPETVAELYFELSTKLGLPWLREKISALPGDAHWQMLAKGAMQDDLSGLQRTITAEVLVGGGEIATPAALIAAWQDRNRRGIERSAQLLSELRAMGSPDAAMLSVALRELRNLV